MQKKGSRSWKISVIALCWFGCVPQVWAPGARGKGMKEHVAGGIGSTLLLNLAPLR
jgi:hypothetical protein